MKILTTIVTLLLASIAFAGGNTRISKQEYIDNWKMVAVSHMTEYNIPASIILSQAILESASGNSELALKGNNHFGIKCHGWEGKKIFIDDDRDNECFRVYKNAEESYRDHSEFLKKYKRYEFLFSYESDDYKSWARGLKKAGYATNPNYPQLLIDIIEDLELNKFDKAIHHNIIKEPSIALVETAKISKHQIQIHENGVKFIIATKGDTYYRLSQEFGLKLSQLYKYNNFSKKKDVLVEGDVIYIQPKRRQKIFKKDEIVLLEATSVNDLSQKYATNINTIKRLNKYSENEEILEKGSRVMLR